MSRTTEDETTSTTGGEATTTLVNTCDRPVELHLGDAVVVLSPLARVGCAAEDLVRGQVRELCRRGVLAVRVTEPDSAPESAAPPVDEQPSASGPPPKRATRHSPARARRTAPSDQE
ncbi:hypothetical protein [Streptomyces sp. NPDC047042]|uniref:hypothetical protein n=1 Tax=Streptomyces sp. NPDC047042 TaxID=3154807 RepID=UPI0033E2297E